MGNFSPPQQRAIESGTNEKPAAQNAFEMLRAIFLLGCLRGETKGSKLRAKWGSNGIAVTG